MIETISMLSTCSNLWGEHHLKLIKVLFQQVSNNSLDIKPQHIYALRQKSRIL
jgi:hypothetical protein